MCIVKINGFVYRSSGDVLPRPGKHQCDDEEKEIPGFIRSEDVRRVMLDYIEKVDSRTHCP